MTADLQKILSGPDALSGAMAFLRERGCQRPVVLTGPSRRFLTQLREAAGNLELLVFDEAVVHVPASAVAKAKAFADDHQGDCIIALGGGAAVGLGKALALDGDRPFVAVPTTYAGSERTAIYGITDDGQKRTGRDPRVRPDAVAYVPAFTQDMARDLTVQSLLNALAHPISALSTGELGEPERAHAVGVAREVFRAAIRLAGHPGDRAARAAAVLAAGDAAQVLESAALGRHHKIAHALGGQFGLPHAALHAVLLPQTLLGLDPKLLAQLPDADPPAALFDALKIAGAPTSLRALLADDASLESVAVAALAPEDHVVVEAAYLGRRPSVHVRRVAIEDGPPASVFGDLDRATDVVLALHGRGADADGILARARELLADAPGFAVVAPAARDNRWYSVSYREARAKCPDEIAESTRRLQAARAYIETQSPGARIHLFGFSQGACMALELIRETAGFASVIALAGTSILPDSPAFGEHLKDTKVLLGAASEDTWLDVADLHRSAEALQAVGADVEVLEEPGDRHQLSLRMRVRAREILTGYSRGAGSFGFGNHHQGEALPGALPVEQNTPRQGPYGLYPELISGTGFTAERRENSKVWLYRIRPAAGHRPLKPLGHGTFCADFRGRDPEINVSGHGPLPPPPTRTDFVDGMHTYGGQGDPNLRRGFAIHLYAANRSMDDRAFQNADGELVILPQEGGLTIQTELGVLDVAPGQLVIIPRGLKFSVALHGSFARGYVAESFGRSFKLPERGPVGSNGLADERHFMAPQPYFEDRLCPGYRLTAKLGGKLHEATLDHSPYDVVAWHGNHVPHVYELSRFTPLATVAFDHQDPSIFTVLTAPMDEPGANTLDLVVFPSRIEATKHTLRPPFFHRNAVTEINGIITQGPGGRDMFPAGVTFLTPCLTAHGVTARSIEGAIDASDEVADRPVRISEHARWFQFETALPISLSKWAAHAPERMLDWTERWGHYRTYYRPTRT